MIKFVEGNFFDYKADIRINTVNCVGVMGAGVALQFKTKYPEMFKEYLKSCNENNVQIGRPHVWTNNSIFNEEENIIIINFPTKLHWKNPSEYDYVEKGLNWLSNFLLGHEGKTITVPALGCGHGGLDWNIVKKMISKHLSKSKLDILVFAPESSTEKNEVQIENKLSNNKIVRLLPSSETYPLKIKGKTSSELYVKGNLDLLNTKLFSLFVNSKPDEKEKNVIFQCLNNNELLKYTFLLGYNSSFEIDIVKYLLSKRASIIIALPYSILNLKIRKDLLEYWDENLITILSIGNPESKWNISDSVKMLKFRFKISNIMLFTYYELTPIIKYKNDVMENNNNHKFFINYWNESINFYQDINATKIGKDRTTNEPNLKPILELLKL
ncbi:macro domain-containing protein [Flavobacterium sp. ENC]|uniref:macro domain-containing protein n=1 Tax=Flavobacterium sp. ENC TaxID=2897330 RepID=UPI001E4CF5BC|nr:macro domain-containing protein [Flavobacterium sp. ENC]MCD0466098.1 macro domain-containing protein [Flavobacterium sp. ENC]